LHTYPAGKPGVSFTIPGSVTGIGAGVFSGCTSLAVVTIPGNVTDIGAGVFSGCTSLAAIEVAGSNVKYSSVDGILYDKTQTTLHTYPAGKPGVSFTIPGSVISIGDGAFYGCTSLVSVTIPGSVTGIGYVAFFGCSSLASVTFEGTIALTGFDIGAFYGLGDLRAKFYATNPIKGTPGTYTTTAPIDEYSVWMKQ
jgi:hypothetical protein